MVLFTPRICQDLPGYHEFPELSLKSLHFWHLGISHYSFHPAHLHKNIVYILYLVFYYWNGNEDLNPSVQFVSVQLLSRVWLFATPWITAHQASLSITNSQSSLKLTVYWVGDAIQPSHPLSSPSPPTPNPSQHQSLFQWVNSSHEVAKVLDFQLQHHSFQRTPRTDLL